MPATSVALYATVVVPSVAIGTFVVNGFELALFRTVVVAGGAADHSIEATPEVASLAEILTVGLLVYQPLLPSVPLVMLALMVGLAVSTRTVIVASAPVLPAASVAE